MPRDLGGSRHVVSIDDLGSVNIVGISLIRQGRGRSQGFPCQPTLSGGVGL
jgi:hypothetical protein